MTEAAHAVVVGGGEPPSPALLKEEMDRRPRPLLLCADSGADAVLEAGLEPDFLVGDLDSVDPAARTALPPGRVVAVAEQETTDLQKVLEHAAALGVKSAVLLGFTGGRTDHTLWNLSLLKRYGDRMDLRFVDDHCELRRVGSRIRFRARAGQKISLCPLDGPANRITTSGLKWQLRGEDLVPGERGGISNEVVADPVEVAVGSGELLLCVHRDSGPGRIELLD